MARASEAGESDLGDEKLVQERKRGESSTDPRFIRRPWDKAERSGESTVLWPLHFPFSGRTMVSLYCHTPGKH